MDLCWANEGAGHARLQEQQKQWVGSCVPQCPGEAQSLSVVGEVRRSQKGREGSDWGQGQRGLVTAPRPSCLEVLRSVHLRKVIWAALGKVEVLVESWKTGNKDAN